MIEFNGWLAAIILTALFVGSAAWGIWINTSRALTAYQWYRRWKRGSWVYYRDTGWMPVRHWQYMLERDRRHPWARVGEFCGCCEHYSKDGAK